jgi:ribosomal protein S12 methylthiotransferase accessory factor YcaO
VKKKEALLLYGAASMLEECGWIQGRLSAGPDGPYCALGAIIEAREELFENDLERFRVENQAYRALCDDVDDSVIHWNDEKGRTAEEVITQFRTTADKLARPWYKKIFAVDTPVTRVVGDR